jgi:hypothetical protein
MALTYYSENLKQHNVLEDEAPRHVDIIQALVRFSVWLRDYLGRLYELLFIHSEDVRGRIVQFGVSLIFLSGYAPGPGTFNGCN